MPLKKYLERAEKEGFALGAFNAANWEVVKAICQAAEKLKAPVIIESSPGEADYIALENLGDLIENAKAKARLPIFLNLDHGKSIEAVKQALKCGFDMVHFDGSGLDFEENKKITKRAVLLARKKKVVIEGELGYISGRSEAFLKMPVEEIQSLGVFTDSDEAKIFVKATGIDVLAVFIGNVHGMYKGEPKLDLERLSQIREKTQCWLSLHGGSGIEVRQIKQAIKRGIVKINVNTELRLAYKKKVKEVFSQSNEVAIYKLMPPVIEAVQKVVEEKIKIFGSAGKR
ncbi:MAG TPA: class II fructose-bisphosphate aldolase [Candidatus Bathyarchaeia archaeon]|nr:class II fructose-bisphosphate aldolase [Candidatus Bathyarchaeia archaeon]